MPPKSWENCAAPKSQSFVAAYRKMYGSDPDQFAAQAYDGLSILAAAIRNAGSADRRAIRDSLAAVRGFKGVLGTFSFDENRDPVHPGVTLIVRDGRFVLYQ